MAFVNKKDLKTCSRDKNLQKMNIRNRPMERENFALVLIKQSIYATQQLFYGASPHNENYVVRGMLRKEYAEYRVSFGHTHIQEVKFCLGEGERIGQARSATDAHMMSEVE